MEYRQCCGAFHRCVAFCDYPLRNLGPHHWLATVSGSYSRTVLRSPPLCLSISSSLSSMRRANSFEIIARTTSPSLGLLRLKLGHRANMFGFRGKSWYLLVTLQDPNWHLRFLIFSCRRQLVLLSSPPSPVARLLCPLPSSFSPAFVVCLLDPLHSRSERLCVGTWVREGGGRMSCVFAI